MHLHGHQVTFFWQGQLYGIIEPSQETIKTQETINIWFINVDGSFQCIDYIAIPDILFLLQKRYRQGAGLITGAYWAYRDLDDVHS
jgi:hypothetical protein